MSIAITHLASRNEELHILLAAAGKRGRHNAAHGAKRAAGRPVGRFDLLPGPLDKLLGNHLHAARLEFRSPPLKGAAKRFVVRAAS